MVLFRYMLFAFLAIIIVPCVSAQTLRGVPMLKDRLDSLSYSLGVNLGKNLQTSGITQVNSDVLAAAMVQVLNKQATQISSTEATTFIDRYIRDFQKARNEANRREGLRFLEQNRTKDGVVVRPSGLQYKVIRQGKGPRPSISDQVTVNYHGTLVDGTVFATTRDRGEPLQCYVNDVILGWMEALLSMNVGSKWILYVPSDLAYGSSPRVGSVEPNSTLIFEIELLEIN